MRVLNPRPGLTRTRSEKGREGSANGKRWEDESVFAYIDTLGQQGLLASDRFVADFLVCDDLGNELADFIALQLSPLRIAFIHGILKQPLFEVLRPIAGEFAHKLLRKIRLSHSAPLPLQIRLRNPRTIRGLHA